MELPTIVNIKSEKEDLEHHTEDFSDFHLDIKVESETAQDLEDYGWCIENGTLYPSNTDGYCEAGDYQQLTQLFKQQCTRCDRYFDDRYTLLQHNLTHLKIYLIQCKNMLKYKCSICNIFYNTTDKLKEHTMVIHGSKYKIKVEHFETDTVELDMQSVESFEIKTLGDENLNTSNSNDSLPIPKSHEKCSECGKVFTYKTWFSHMKDVHSNVRSICSLCKKSFKCERYLRRHILYQHGDTKPIWRSHKVGDKELKCEQCPTVFINKYSLKSHMRNCHTERVECDICKSKLKSKAYLHTHMVRVHYDDGKDHICDICGRKFKSPRYLKIHMKNKHKAG